MGMPVACAIVWPSAVNQGGGGVEPLFDDGGVGAFEQGQLHFLRDDVESIADDF
jgi:hypothetical protein